jgi:hypothetical protein
LTHGEGGGGEGGEYENGKGFGLRILVLLFCIRVSPSCSACEGSSVQFARRGRESELTRRLWILFYVAA